MDTFTNFNARLYSPALGRVSVIVQLLYMKIVSILKSERCFPTAFHFNMRGNIKDYIPMRIYFFGFWEPNLSRYMIDTIKPGAVAVDVGANIGYYSLLMSQLVGRAGKVIAIEAAPDTFTRLEDNLNLNQCPNVYAKNIAVTAKQGQIKIFRSRFGDFNSGAATIVEYDGAEEGCLVESNTLMSILGDDVSKISFLKIDIEGAEMPVLDEIVANRDRFAKPLTVVSELSDANNPVIEKFRASGFRCAYIENDYTIAGYLKALHSASTTAPSELGPNNQRPPTADLVFTYDGAGWVRS